MSNLTSMFAFLLLEFSDIRELQLLHFFAFLALYLIALTGNLLIILAVALDHHLHTPMYFFLMNLAVLDIGTLSVVVPKSMAMSLMNNRSISYYGCVAQVFFYIFFATSNFSLLTIMAHDRNVAIFNPLEYERIMHKGACLQMVAIGEMISFLYAALQTSGTFAITFCSHVVHQFFCEIPQLLKLSCSDIYLIDVGFLVLGFSLALGCFIFIIVTYVKIFSMVLRIPSVHGRKKALSTCIPHLIVVSVFLIDGLFGYVSPSLDASTGLDRGFAVIYTIIPPMLNPFIYSMRNKEIKTALWKILTYGALLKNHV